MIWVAVFLCCMYVCMYVCMHITFIQLYNFTGVELKLSSQLLFC